MQEDIHFYYTNDLHSDFTYWSRVINFIKNERLKRQQEGKSTFLADVGDHVDRVDPIAEAFMGKANVQLLNDANYDVVTLGNNEGITLAHEDLFSLYDNADFQVVCANLTSKTNKQPTWLQSDIVLPTNKGTKIGVIGLTAPFYKFYNLLKWDISFPLDILKDKIIELHQSVDIIVLLSHLGINEDRQIARNFPEIDVIIGGHTHHLLKTGETVNETLLTAAGKHCAYVGEVILTWDHEKRMLINKEAYAINIAHLEKDSHTEERILSLNEQADHKLKKEIVRINDQITVDPFKETLIIKQLSDTLKDWTHADCSMINAGLLLDHFESGLITYKEVHQICPHPINPCVVNLTGDELYEVIRAAHTDELINLKLKGFGFRGKVIGKIIFSGLAINLGTYKNGSKYVQEVLFKGRPLNRKQQYKLATVDMFTFGRLFPEIARSSEKHYYLPELIRDLLVKTLQDNYH